MDAKTMTAVEWLVEELAYHYGSVNINNTVIVEQAKAMEEEHICMAYNDGRVNAGLKLNRTAQQYYNETFNK